MKIDIDNETLFELTDHQKKVIQWDIPEEEFEDDIKRRIQYVIEHKYKQCLNRMMNEWEPKLKQRFEKLPTDYVEITNIIMKQDDYKDRSKRNEYIKQQDLKT